MAQSEVPNHLPCDWANEALRAHGVSRAARRGGYVVVLSLNHRQVLFGPYRTNIAQAADANDALCKYFLPFLKTTPRINRDVAAFFTLKDEDAFHFANPKRLAALRQRLTVEYANQGLDIKAEQDRRCEFLLCPPTVAVKQRNHPHRVPVKRAIRDLQKFVIWSIISRNKPREWASSVVTTLEERICLSKLLEAVTAQGLQFQQALENLTEKFQTLQVVIDNPDQPNQPTTATNTTTP
jgi:hypothetical protein